jgi:hypothetical protein
MWRQCLPRRQSFDESEAPAAVLPYQSSIQNFSIKDWHAQPALGPRYTSTRRFAALKRSYLASRFA